MRFYSSLGEHDGTCLFVTSLPVSVSCAQPWHLGRSTLSNGLDFLVHRQASFSMAKPSSSPEQPAVRHILHPPCIGSRPDGVDLNHSRYRLRDCESTCRAQSLPPDPRQSIPRWWARSATICSFAIPKDYCRRLGARSGGLEECQKLLLRGRRKSQKRSIC